MVSPAASQCLRKLSTGSTRSVDAVAAAKPLGNMLDRKHFFQINRQFIVAINSITNIHNYFNGKLKIQLAPIVDEEVIVSRERAGELKIWLN